MNHRISLDRQDRYQGAENEIVIVSLVRSNCDKKIGFLGTEDGKNRMCVAQSRAARSDGFMAGVAVKTHGHISGCSGNQTNVSGYFVCVCV